MSDSDNVVNIHQNRVLSASHMFQKLADEVDDNSEAICIYHKKNGELSIAHTSMEVRDMAYFHRIMGIFVDSEIFE